MVASTGFLQSWKCWLSHVLGLENEWWLGYLIKTINDGQDTGRAGCFYVSYISDTSEAALIWHAKWKKEHMDNKNVTREANGICTLFTSPTAGLLPTLHQPSRLPAHTNIQQQQRLLIHILWICALTHFHLCNNLSLQCHRGCEGCLLITPQKGHGQVWNLSIETLYIAVYTPPKANSKLQKHRHINIPNWEKKEENCKVN